MFTKYHRIDEDEQRFRSTYSLINLNQNGNYLSLNRFVGSTKNR